MLVGILLSTLGVTQAGPAAQPLPVLDADGFQNLAATLMSRLDELESKNQKLEANNHKFFFYIYSLVSFGRILQG